MGIARKAPARSLAAAASLAVSLVPATGHAQATAALTPATLDDALVAVFDVHGLTSEQAATEAVATSLDVASRGEQARAADRDVDGATVSLFPRLAFVGKYARYSEITPPTLGNLVVAPAAPTGVPLAAGHALVSVPVNSFPYGVPVDAYCASATLVVPVSDYVFRLT
jgi:hypothetical protein